MRLQIPTVNYKLIVLRKDEEILKEVAKEVPKEVLKEVPRAVHQPPKL
jgi:hypothetical protein